MRKTLVVIGVGLIGGSAAKSFRKAFAVGHIIGVGRGQENLGQALDSGLIDEVSTDAEAAVGSADWVLVATPAGQIPAVFEAIAHSLPDDAIILDAGSTKQDVIAAGRKHLGKHFSRFVPGHPVAGAEISGCQGARAELFSGKPVILTPHEGLQDKALEEAKDFWQSCGAVVTLMDAQIHDRIFAAVSHLPHALSYALVDMLAGRPDSELLFSYAASGFRDFTRIAASSPEMWRDICLANRGELMQVLAEYRDRLNEMLTWLTEEDTASLLKMFSHARSARNRWGQDRQ